MKTIKEFLFGRRTAPVTTIKEGYRTVYPSKKPRQDQWMREFNVSLLHNKKAVYFN